MPVRLSCPSCNTSFTLPDLPAERRAACPRCSDVFPIRTWEETADNNVPPAAVPALTTHYSPLTTPRRAVLIALGMGLVGLTIGLVAYYTRGGARGKPGPEPGPTAAVTPAPQLMGIGYLPADVNIAFAVQPGPVLAYADRTRQDPRTLLTSAGVPARLLDTLGQLGLTLDQIDHVAGGTSIGDGALEIRLALVLVLRGPLADEDHFLQHLKAKRQAGSKPRYEVELAGLPLALARVSDTVWVFGFDAKKDLAAVDRDGYGPGGEQLPAGLTEMLRDRVPPEAAAWIATADERWADKPGVKLAARALGKPEWLPVLARGRAGMLALSLGDPPRVRLFVKTADEATGQQVRDYFKRLAEADDAAQHGGAGEFAFFDMPLDPARALATLERFLADAGRKQ